MNHTKLEDGIHAVWGVKDIVDTFMWRYLDHPKPMTEDEVWNHLAAISTLLDLHCEKLFDTYCQVFKLDNYAPDDVMAHREKVLAGILNTPPKELLEKTKKKTKKAK